MQLGKVLMVRYHNGVLMFTFYFNFLSDSEDCFVYGITCTCIYI